jgi:tRNA(fMet)-specific endonuclease VapC
MGLIVDSSVLIAAERNTLDWAAFVRDLSNQSLFISSITLSELWHAYHRGKGLTLPRRLDFIRQIEASIPVLAFATEEALVHAKIWAELEKIGQRIGLHDLIIAATALAHDSIVATLNENEFRRIPGLRLTPVKKFLLK